MPKPGMHTGQEAGDDLNFAMSDKAKPLFDAVVKFIRERQFRVVAPEVLGLPPTTSGAELGLARGGPLLAEALLAGDEESARVGGA